MIAVHCFRAGIVCFETISKNMHRFSAMFRFRFDASDSENKVRLSDQKFRQFNSRLKSGTASKIRFENDSGSSKSYSPSMMGWRTAASRLLLLLHRTEPDAGFFGTYGRNRTPQIELANMP
jgi:hypothetical protein